jgi:hypothetical protein
VSLVYCDLRGSEMSDLYTVKDLTDSMILIECFTTKMFEDGDFIPWLENVTTRLARTKGLNIEDYEREDGKEGVDMNSWKRDFVTENDILKNKIILKRPRFTF